MNLGGGASNVDLSEAAQLLKQSSASPGVPTQTVPPQFMLMHQAVAMQQFQFQQALLLQQMMASQQAQARAATVKSAAEMAAARAAEISKQLKGNNAEGEEEKKGPDRSKSQSPSRLRSVSTSRSPIRYRRERSASRSPIRYRRDYRLSPSRSRDFYSYRSRSRRGYYRGRGDYPWNPSFRRDWDRDRDHYGRASHRSRSRSRSRVHHRSHSYSHSPRGRREKSGTPPQYRRDERRGGGQGSRRSRSRDLKASPSHSSRSPSGSLNGEDASPLRKSKDSRRGQSLSPEMKSGRLDLTSSPAHEYQIENLHLEDSRGSIGGDVEGKMILENKEMKALSMSPRSLSVSLSPRQKSPEKQYGADDDNLGMSTEKAILQEAAGRKVEGLAIPEKAISNRTFSLWATEARVSSPEAVHKESPASVVAKDSGEGFVGWQLRKESGGKGGVYVDDDSGEDKELDDWRDDMKAHDRERVKRKETKRDSGKLEDNKRGMARQVPSIQDLEQSAVASRGQIMKNSGTGNEDGSTVSLELVRDFGVSMKRSLDAVGKEFKKSLDVIKHKDVYRDLIDADPPMMEKIGRGSVGAGRRDQKLQSNAEVSTQDGVKDINRDSTDDSEMEREVNAVFEGPTPPCGDAVGLKHGGLRKSEDSSKGLIRKSYKRSRDEENDKEIGTHQLELEDEKMVHYKGKEKSRSGDRSKRHEDDAERDRRKDRHRKHRRKHRHRDEDTEKEDDDMVEEVKADTEGRKNKEERSHQRKHHSWETDDERRDRKKRKHKHRGKTASESPAPEFQIAEAEGGPDNIVEYKKISSSRDKRRGGIPKSPGYSGSASE